MHKTYTFYVSHSINVPFNFRTLFKRLGTLLYSFITNSGDIGSETLTKVSCKFSQISVSFSCIPLTIAGHRSSMMLRDKVFSKLFRVIFRKLANNMQFSGAHEISLELLSV